jgi:hypothetical protein
MLYDSTLRSLLSVKHHIQCSERHKTEAKLNLFTTSMRFFSEIFFLLKMIIILSLMSLNRSSHENPNNAREEESLLESRSIRISKILESFL